MSIIDRFGPDLGVVDGGMDKTRGGDAIVHETKQQTFKSKIFTKIVVQGYLVLTNVSYRLLGLKFLRGHRCIVRDGLETGVGKPTGIVKTRMAVLRVVMDVETVSLRESDDPG